MEQLNMEEIREILEARRKYLLQIKKQKEKIADEESFKYL